MTHPRRFLTGLILCGLAATLSCGGDGDSVLDPEEQDLFDVLTGCSPTCVGGFVTIVDGFSEIMEWLAAGIDTTVGDRSLNLVTGAFGFDLDMDGKSGQEIQFRGVVTPDSVCFDGMQQHDVCIAEWDMFDIPTTAQVGQGTFSVVALGFTGPPYSTYSYRVTIARENTWIETEDGCRLDVTGIDMIVYPFADPQLRSAIVQFTMTATGVYDEITGGMYYAYDPQATSQIMSLSGQQTVDGTTSDFSCTLDLGTITLSCS